jgi:hypothetical protein
MTQAAIEWMWAVAMEGLSYDDCARVAKACSTAAPIHTSAESVAFLADIVVNQPRGKEIDVIADNLSAHKSQPVKDFLEHRRFICISLRPIPLNSTKLNFGSPRLNATSSLAVFLLRFPTSRENSGAISGNTTNTQKQQSGNTSIQAGESLLNKLLQSTSLGNPGTCPAFLVSC